MKVKTVELEINWTKSAINCKHEPQSCILANKDFDPSLSFCFFQECMPSKNHKTVSRIYKKKPYKCDHLLNKTWLLNHTYDINLMFQTLVSQDSSKFMPLLGSSIKWIHVPVGWNNYARHGKVRSKTFVFRSNCQQFIFNHLF